MTPEDYLIMMKWLSIIGILQVVQTGFLISAFFIVLDKWRDK